MRDQPTVPNRARPTRPEPATVPHRMPPSRGVPAPRREQPTLRSPVPEPARPDRPLPPVRPVALPLLLPALGGAWWAVGTAALDTGPGTLLLALGLSAAVALGIALRRRMGRGAPLPRGGRAGVLKLAVIAVAGIVLGGYGLRWLGLGEITVPFACAVVALALFGLVRIVDERVLLALAGALLVLSAVGASLALGTAGSLYPQGLVGMGAGALCCGVAAVRGGLVAELLARRARH